MRYLVGITMIGVLTVVIVSPAAGQQEHYPNRPIRFIVPFAPGGTVDIIARLLGAKLGKELAHHLIVDNRGGAGSTIGTAVAAKATADGHTILMGNIALSVNETLYPNLPYTVLKDFTPISLVGATPNVLVVHKALPVKNVKEFIALAKAHPGELAYGSGGAGGAAHISVELLQVLAEIKVLHVPYRGGAPALLDTVSGRLQFMLVPVPPAVSLIKAGQLRALGVSGLKRSPILPDVPTISESGVRGYEFRSWYGILAPAGTPKAIISHLNEATRKVLAMADLLEKLGQQGLEPESSTPNEFSELIGTEINKWRKIIDTAAR